MQTRVNTVDCTKTIRSICYNTESYERLSRDKQHLVQLVCVGGLYVPKADVQAMLAPEPGVTKRILDLGL